MAVTLFYLIVIAEAQRLHSPIPNNLWQLFLIPLFITSYIGNTTRWIILLMVAMGIHIVLNLLASTFYNSTIVWHIVLTQIGVSVGMLLLVAIIFHISVLQRRASDSILSAMQRLSNDLHQSENFEGVYDTVAQEIRRYFAPEKPLVHILIHDITVNRLKVEGGIGLEPQVIKKIELPPGKGVTGLAFAENAQTNADNINSEKWKGQVHLVDGMENTKSELATPIRLGDSPIGILDIASENINEFQEVDEVVATNWANILALSFARLLSIREQSRSVSQLIQEIMDASSENETEEYWFDAIYAKVRTHLNVAELVFMRLAPGTGYPILPLLHSHTNPIHTVLENRHYFRLPLDVYLWSVIERWETTQWAAATGWDDWGIYATYSEMDARLLAALNEAEMKHVVAIPVGTNPHRVGLLFLLYDRSIALSEIQDLNFKAIGNALETSYKIVLAKAGLVDGIGNKIHQSLSGLNTLEKKVVHSFASIPNEVVPIRDDIQQIRHNIEGAVQGVDEADFFQLNTLEFSKVLAVEKAAFHGLGLTVHMPEDVDFIDNRYSLDIRRALIRVIHEALENALRHGYAKHATVLLDEDDDCLYLEVKDDGSGLKRPLNRTKSLGIKHLRKLFQNTLGARLRLYDNNPTGVCVSFEIPIRPSID